MTIRNIVPRNNNEGQLGTENKKWNKIYTNEIFATNFTGNLTGTADNAIKDNKSQQIDATYIKNISINNDTLTVTKGNGSTSTTTVNNVSRAEYSDRVGTNAGYTGSTTGSSLKGGLSQASIYNNSFPFAYGNLISVKNSGANQIALEWSGTTGAVGRVAVRSARDVALGTWSAWRYLAYTESPAFSGSPTAPTPGTSDNGTRIATTAFVQSLINSLKGSIDGTIVASNLAQNGYVKFSNGLILQWGNTRGGTTVTFPVSFTTLFSLSAVQQYAGYLAQGAAVNNWSSSKFTANSSSENGHGNQYIFWIAVGK